MRIAIDVMGGDFAPQQNISGLKAAMVDFPQVTKFLLVGEPERMKREMLHQGVPLDHPRIELVPASQWVEMGESSSVAVRQKKDSSITVAAGLIKDKRADAMVSAGHTGAAVASTVVKVRMLPGIDRPGIACVMPAPPGKFVLLDAGANVDCKPLHLAQYAILGEAYARHVLGVAQPRVGILSVGAEDGKGNDLTRESFALLKLMPVNFIGNVEGHDLFVGHVDVVVCDGFVGNAVLKCIESLAKAMSNLLKERLAKTPVRMAGALLSKNAFRELKEITDHEEYGGAPLLGINGSCIIAHGSSSPKAIRNAIRVSCEMVGNRLNEHILKKVQAVDWAALPRHEK